MVVPWCFPSLRFLNVLDRLKRASAVFFGHGAQSKSTKLLDPPLSYLIMAIYAGKSVWLERTVMGDLILGYIWNAY